MNAEFSKLKINLQTFQEGTLKKLGKDKYRDDSLSLSDIQWKSSFFLLNVEMAMKWQKRHINPLWPQFQCLIIITLNFLILSKYFRVFPSSTESKKNVMSYQGQTNLLGYSPPGQWELLENHSFHATPFPLLWLWQEGYLAQRTTKITTFYMLWAFLRSHFH